MSRLSPLARVLGGQVTLLSTQPLDRLRERIALRIAEVIEPPPTLRRPYSFRPRNRFGD